MRIAALIVAAGRGTRAGGELPKQYRELGGVTVLAHSTNAFLHHQSIDKVQVITHPDDADIYARTMKDHEKLLPSVHGGETRSESVLNGLRALAGFEFDAVLIHDAARPFVSNALISRVITALDKAEGAVPTLPAVDAMRRITEGDVLGDPVPREGIGRAQTPQGFKINPLVQAYDISDNYGALDDAEIAIAAGMHVVSVPGDPANFKLTIPEDFAMAERLVSPAIRMGQGFDVHAFADGDSVTLCGVTVPHNQGLTGHSDADVGLHALTDALFGAVASGDIGQHFPPSDPQWKGCDSAVFLAHAVKVVAEAGYQIGNLDVTLICEMPKIGPHADKMRARIAEICGIETGQVSVKATTTERLGFCGRSEGIAAQAIATVMRAA